MALDEKLRQVFLTVFDVELDDSLSIHTLEAWDSLAHVTLMIEIESVFNVTVAAVSAMDMTDVLAIKEFLRCVLVT